MLSLKLFGSMTKKCKIMNLFSSNQHDKRKYLWQITQGMIVQSEDLASGQTEVSHTISKISPIY